MSVLFVNEPNGVAADMKEFEDLIFGDFWRYFLGFFV